MYFTSGILRKRAVTALPFCWWHSRSCRFSTASSNKIVSGARVMCCPLCSPCMRTFLQRWPWSPNSFRWCFSQDPDNLPASRFSACPSSLSWAPSVVGRCSQKQALLVLGPACHFQGPVPFFSLHDREWPEISDGPAVLRYCLESLG